MKKDLYHYGVVGMRWGVRRLESEGAEIAREKGETVHHITESAELALRNASFYTSYTKKDLLRYRGEFAMQVMDCRNVKKVFDQSYKTTERLITPNKKRAVDEFLELYKNEPNIIDRVAESKSKSSAFFALLKVFGNEKRQRDKYQKLLTSDKPEDKQKMFHEFMAYTLLDPVSQKRYFDHLRKKGFNSIYDFNDVLNKYSEKPLIVFDAKSQLLFNEKNEISSKQAMNNFVEDYESKDY